ncbi:hypothetical protein JTM67_35555, partial [Pseudomonas aeruginosa]|nr:hypothetical protein [Pseudomonas aeruginosa]
LYRIANGIKPAGDDNAIVGLQRSRLLRGQLGRCMGRQRGGCQESRRQEGVFKLHKNNPLPCANHILVLLLTENV